MENVLVAWSTYLPSGEIIQNNSIANIKFLIRRVIQNGKY